MRRFAELFESLDTTTSTRAKIEAMSAYFRIAAAADAAWAVYVLIGRRLKRSVGPALLRTWLLEEAALPGWLIDETYGSIGDLAETIALLMAAESRAGAAPLDVSLSDWFTQRILPLARQSVEERRRHIVGWWHELPYRECFLVNKLLTGALRVGVSRSLVTRALAECLDQPRIQLERALIGEWQPSAAFWEALTRNEGNLDVAQPYPFYLASPLEPPVDRLGNRDDWLAEWKWDGIRGQIVRRAGQCTLWSRGEDIITDRFPEIVAAAGRLPDSVLDGEVLAWVGERALPFARLQQRIGRSKLTSKILQDIPARFVAYDLLELDGEDLRARPLKERRGRLERLLQQAATPALGLSPEVDAVSWDALAAAREQARTRGVEGLMLKEWQSAYGTGRQRGAWWKWKIDPFVFDGVLLYAAPGHGRRSNLYTDYTFGVWHGDMLVPVAKAYSGLTDVEIRDLDKWIRAHTREKFGIVRSVEPTHVFELAFEGIARSTRHKSGIALRFPRILQWRSDKPPAEADTLANLAQLLAEQPGHAGEIAARLRQARAWFASRHRTAFEFQEALWRAYWNGESGLLNAGTGMGKTMAAWLGPLLESGLDAETPGIRVIWLTPLRALAHDLEAALCEPLQFLGSSWRVEQRTGDTPTARRARQVKKPPQALVTTPESLSLMLSHEHMLPALGRVEALIVDEWHEFLGSKRGVQLELAAARLRALSPRLRVWGLSATLPDLPQAMSTLLGPGRSGRLVRAADTKRYEIEALLPDSLARFPWAGHLGLKLLPEVLAPSNSAAAPWCSPTPARKPSLWYSGDRPRPGSTADHDGAASWLHRCQDPQAGGGRDQIRRPQLRDLHLVARSRRRFSAGPIRCCRSAVRRASPGCCKRAGRSGHQPGEASRVTLVPTHALELLECAAARYAAERRELEPRRGMRLALDVLAQHLVTLAAGGGFEADAMLCEVRGTHAFAALGDAEWSWVLDFITRGGKALQGYPQFRR